MITRGEFDEEEEDEEDLSTLSAFDTNDAIIDFSISGGDGTLYVVRFHAWGPR